MFEVEENVFRENLGNLLQNEIGKYILIKEDKIIGIYQTSLDALKIGYETFKEQSFLIKQILPFQQPLNFANNFQLK